MNRFNITVLGQFKHERRNNLKINPKFEIQMFKTFEFRSFNIRICFKFRYSHFALFNIMQIRPLVDSQWHIRFELLGFYGLRQPRNPQTSDASAKPLIAAETRAVACIPPASHMGPPISAPTTRPKPPEAR